MIKVSVPGKVHLLGEHSVVYGKPALLSAINLRVYITIFSADKKQILDPNILKLQRALENKIAERFNLKNIPAYSLHITSDLPIGSGLGSSASFSAGVTAAILSFLKIDWTPEVIYQIAFEGERLFHGNPSGGDLATVISGKTMLFRREYGSSLLPPTIEIANQELLEQFILIDSGKPEETTKQMVEIVGNKYKAASRKLNKIFDELEGLTIRLSRAFKKGDEEEIIQIISAGQSNLEKIGVVGEKAKEIIREVTKVNGAAKIMGGGGIKKGSGMLLAVHVDQSRLLNLAKEMDWNIIRIKLGEEGLRIENNE